jgi:hypothetical protein
MRDRAKKLRRPAGWVALLAGALTFGGGAIVLAEGTGTIGSITYVEHDIFVGAPTLLRGAAKCPVGTHVIGGGFSSDALVASPAAMYPSDGGDADDVPDQWTAQLHVDGSGTQATHFYAVCEPGTHGYPSTSVRVNAGKTATAKIPCGPGAHVLDGGIKALEPEGPGAGINSSYPYDSSDRGNTPDDGWKVRLFNGTPEDGKAKAIAVCRKAPASYFKESTLVVPSSSTAAIPACPASKHVLGLGIKLKHDASEGVPRALRPRDLSADGDTVTDDDVLANAANAAGAATTKKLTGYAVCGKHS